MKIETGCKAVITGTLARNIGIEVVVGSYIGEVPGFVSGDYWEIDKRITSFKGRIIRFCRESNLRRIDDGLGSWEELSNIWIPIKEDVLA